MDPIKLQQFLEYMKKKTGQYPSLSSLFNIFQPQARSYTDIPHDNWGNRNWVDDKFDRIQNPYLIGDKVKGQDFRDDMNLMYGKLNDLYRSDPIQAKQLFKMLEDKQNQDAMGEWANPVESRFKM